MSCPRPCRRIPKHGTGDESGAVLIMVLVFTAFIGVISIALASLAGTTFLVAGHAEDEVVDLYSEGEAADIVTADLAGTLDDPDSGALRTCVVPEYDPGSGAQQGAHVYKFTSGDQDVFVHCEFAGIGARLIEGMDYSLVLLDPTEKALTKKQAQMATVTGNVWLESGTICFRAIKTNGNEMACNSYTPWPAWPPIGVYPGAIQAQPEESLTAMRWDVPTACPSDPSFDGRFVVASGAGANVWNCNQPSLTASPEMANYTFDRPSDTWRDTLDVDPAPEIKPCAAGATEICRFYRPGRYTTRPDLRDTEGSQAITANVFQPDDGAGGDTHGIYFLDQGLRQVNDWDNPAINYERQDAMVVGGTAVVDFWTSDVPDRCAPGMPGVQFIVGKGQGVYVGQSNQLQHPGRGLTLCYATAEQVSDITDTVDAEGNPGAALTGGIALYQIPWTDFEWQGIGQQPNFGEFALHTSAAIISNAGGETLHGVVYAPRGALNVGTTGSLQTQVASGIIAWNLTIKTRGTDGSVVAANSPIEHWKVNVRIWTCPADPATASECETATLTSLPGRNPDATAQVVYSKPKNQSVAAEIEIQHWIP